MNITPLDGWIIEKTGGMKLGRWQLEQLNKTLATAMHSPFYKNRLPGDCLNSIEDLQSLPFMDGGDIAQQGARLLCVPLSQVERIVTLHTSGATATPKRLYFSNADLELTADFFARGLPTVAKPGSTMAVLLPCKSPHGVGDMICRALKRIPVKAVPSGMLESFEATAAMLNRERVTSLVGMPVQVLSLKRYLAANGISTALNSVLLSADTIPALIVRELNEYGLNVYKHFGMTESGYGCAIDCDAHAGQHIREADLLLEIIDPANGKALSRGEWGEIVITTLTRHAMPLVRYRTGDYSRIVPGTCPCSSTLARLDDVHGRWREGCALPNGQLKMLTLDEHLLALPQVMDFAATYGFNTLQLHITTFATLPGLSENSVREALSAIAALGDISIEITIEVCKDYLPLHKGKRMISAIKK